MRSLIPRTRMLCLWFPDWPIQRLLAADPALRRGVLLVVVQTPRGEIVAYGNDVSRRRGVRPGMPVSEAKSFLRRRDVLSIHPLQPDEDRRGLGDLAPRCDAFSPCVGVEEGEAPQSLLLDVTGVDHFFSGEAALAEQLAQVFLGERYDVRIAIAGTVGAAWAAAHCLARPRQPAIVSAEQFAGLSSLPVSGLRLGEADLKKLRRLGMRTIGELLQLDRNALQSRFSSDLPARLDQFTGERPEGIARYVPPPCYRLAESLEEGLVHPEAIEAWWSTLLSRLLQRLAPQRLGVRQLDCRFVCETGAATDVSVRLCQAAADARYIGDLLRLKLERVPWPAAVSGVSVEAVEVAPLESAQHEFFADLSHDQSRQLGTLLNRLSSRLGEAAVIRPELLSDPVPERSVREVPVTAEAGGHSASKRRSREQPRDSPAAGSSALLPLDRPTGLFRQPRPVEVVSIFPDGPPTVLFWNNMRMDIECSWGPERIEFGWWRSEFIRRDCYRVETTEGRRLWLFRRRGDHRWFWQGELF